ncbi:asialoglycoprotein receptor 1-like [Gastrophryne carolinensis]
MASVFHETRKGGDPPENIHSWSQWSSHWVGTPNSHSGYWRRFRQWTVRGGSMEYSDLQHLHHSEDRQEGKAGGSGHWRLSNHGERWWQQPISSRLLAILFCVCIGLVIVNIGITVAGRGSQSVKSDPASPDCVLTKGGGETSSGACPDDWSQSRGSCYYLSNMALPFPDAQIMCQRRKAALAVIGSREEQAFLTKFSMKTRVWIGLREVDGKWTWVDGTPLSSTPTKWGPGQPDEFTGHGLGGDEDCVQFNYSGDWNDEHCSRAYRYICERPALTT